MQSAVDRKRVYFVSLGCPKNHVDTEVMLGQAGGAGYDIVDAPDEASVIVVNTCGFIDAAKEESIDTILEMAQYKGAGACETLVVTGCLSQRYPDALAAEIPEVDHIFGSGDYDAVGRLLAAGAAGANGRARKLLPVVTVSDTPSYLYDHTTTRQRAGKNAFSTYVKIAEGCDRPCSFCIIPKLRGPQRSRSVDSVVAEIAQLGAEGVREVNLIAQDLTRYGADLADPKPTLASLLRAIEPVDGIDWVRLHYTYPSAFSDELIEVIARSARVVPYIDVPLQHINSELLKRMRRGHSARVIRGLVDELRGRIDGLVLRTTFIVGHPGETDAAFDELCEFVTAAEFERVGVFTYSREAGTHSATLDDEVPADVAEQRRDHLMELQREISRRNNDAMVGERIDVLVEGVSKESEYLLEGRWYGQAPGIDGTVYLTDGSAETGDIVSARITTAADYDLAATLEA